MKLESDVSNQQQWCVLLSSCLNCNFAHFFFYRQEFYAEKDNVFRPHVERVFAAERRVRHGAVLEGSGQHGRNCDGAL